MQRLNYDLIAEQYDERLREYELDSHLVEYLKEHPDLSPETIQVLDVGCGTGTQLVANRVQFPAHALVGVDYSAGMLRVAKKKEPAINWLQATSAYLPLPAQHFDYVTSQFAYQHMADKERFMAEIGRVLKPKGQVVIRNIDPWSMPRWLIYRYFPLTEERDRQDFWTSVKMMQTLKENGFTQVRIKRVVQRPVQPLADFLAYAQQRHRASQFMALPDLEYTAGLVQIQDQIAQSDDKNLLVESELCFITFTAVKI